MSSINSSSSSRSWYTTVVRADAIGPSKQPGRQPRTSNGTSSPMLHPATQEWNRTSEWPGSTKCCPHVRHLLREGHSAASSGKRQSESDSESRLLVHRLSSRATNDSVGVSRTGSSRTRSASSRSVGSPRRSRVACSFGSSLGEGLMNLLGTQASVVSRRSSNSIGSV
jgi:hypothetical protein